MSGGELDPVTWRWANACATWTFERVPAPGETLVEAMAACARGLVVALPGFAVPAAAEWTTEAAGDDAVVHGRGTRIDEAVITATFRAHPDVVHLAFDLDLQVARAGAEATEVTLDDMIQDGARLHVEREDDVIAIWLALNVDLYARRTFGVERDNTQLAAQNAPRLTAFLQRLVEATGARFHRVDAPSYADQATPLGFA